MASALLAGVLFAAAPLTSAQPDVCEPDAGPIVLEVESAPPTSNWVVETSIPGYTGSAYYRWNGPNHFNQPGNGVLAYTVNVDTPGTYNLRIRNFHDNPDQTLENDCWVRLDGGTWEKAYSSIALEWNWATWFDPPGGSDHKAFWTLSAGPHSFEISARSNDFRIDRVHFYIEGTPGGIAETWPESSCPSAWVNLGSALAGTGGVAPSLTGEGPLTSASLNVVTLSGALPGSTTYLVLGLSVVAVPFKGGVLVPAPDVLFEALPVDGGGGLALPFNWPASVPAGVNFAVQHWVIDPGGPKGFAASNGLLGQSQ